MQNVSLEHQRVCQTRSYRLLDARSQHSVCALLNQQAATVSGRMAAAGRGGLPSQHADCIALSGTSVCTVTLPVPSTGQGSPFTQLTDARSAPVLTRVHSELRIRASTNRWLIRSTAKLCPQQVTLVVQRQLEMCQIPGVPPSLWEIFFVSF